MHQQRNDFDRFIPRRSGTNVDILNYILLKDCRNKSTESDGFDEADKRFTNKAYSRWQRKMLRERVWSHTIMPNNILTFGRSQMVRDKPSFHCQLWPVRPRSKPLIGSPITVLDMPHFEGDIYYHGTDWGKSGHLASVCGGEVFVWHPDINGPKQITHTSATVGNCLRWNNNGNIFAVAWNVKGIAIFDFVEKKIVEENFCICTSRCWITSIEWTKTNSLIISGCNCGRLCVWSRQLRLLNFRFDAHDGIILKLSLSCNERYLASSGDDGNVRIWSWPSLEEHFQVSFIVPIRGVAWHPWKDSLLAIGGGVGNGSLTIWNVTNMKELGYKPALDYNALSIDNLTFNPITAELVVSYWQRCKPRAGVNVRSSIVVLSNLSTEVDAIEWHTGRIVYLLWGEEGGTLASAGTDENLCIWKFLRNSSNDLKQNKKAGQKKNDPCSFVDTARRFATIR